MKKMKLPSDPVGLTLIVFCTLFGSVGFFTPSAASKASSPQFTANITAFARGSNAVVYHVPSNKIYASLPSSTDTSGNSIARIDPDTGTIEQTLWVGSEPEKLVLASDGNTLYVKLRGARTIRKVDLETFTAGPELQLGRSSLYGPHQVVDFAVPDSNPNLVAVSRNSDGVSGSRGVAIFDNAVQRANTGGSSGALAFAESESLLFGNSYDGGDLQKLILDASGVSSVTTTPGSGGSLLQYLNGRLYNSYGRVLDPSTGGLMGTFTFPDLAQRPFFIDAASHRIFFVERTYQGIEIRCFDIDTFVPVGSVLLQNAPGVPKNVVRWGTNGLVISTPDGFTYFVRSDLVGPGSLGTPATTPTPQSTPYPRAFVRRVDIPNNGIVYNDLDQKIYASVPSAAGPGLGNTITRVDPQTGATVSSVFIGSEPKKLALSNDGTTLYASLAGANAIRRFDTVTQTPGLQFTPTTGTLVSDMAVLPGSPQTLVVSSAYAIGIYDNGTMRPNAPGISAGLIESDGTPNVMYGYNTASSGSNLYKLGVTPSGLSVLSDAPLVFYGWSLDMRFSSGRLFTPNGRVIDPENNRILGHFNVPDLTGKSVVVDAALGRAFILTSTELAAYDINTFNKIGSIPNPVSSSSAYEPADLTRWGTNGLAFRNRTQDNYPTDQIYVIQTSLVSSNGTIPTGYYLDAPTRTVQEYLSAIPINVTRTGDLSVSSTIDYATANGTALAGTDYVATSGTATFAPGEATKTINIPLIQDTLHEGSETLSFTLSNPTGTSAEIIAPGSTAVTLTDDDPQPNIAGLFTIRTEPPVGLMRAVNVPVRLSNSSIETITVNFATANATATAGTDYVATSGTLTFNPMEIEKSISIQIIGDGTPEPDEFFYVSLSGPTNSTVQFPQSPVSIRNLNGAARVFDFDDDSRTDIGIFRPSGSASEWWINRSSTDQTFALQFGAATDLIAPADYTGDGKTDIAFFRPSSGEWYVLRSEDLSFFALPFGANADVPVPADYDADGKADFAVFRPSNSTWFLAQSSGSPTRIFQFGITGDKPVVADYDGDGNADVGIFRPAASGGEWWIQRSTAGLLAIQFGLSTDKAVQGDYTGDGKADIAIWRPSTGDWFIVRSEDASFYGFPFGTTGDVPSPGDYDGDGKFDPTVFRPSTVTWFIGRSTAGTQIVQFGATGDKPIPNAFIP